MKLISAIWNTIKIDRAKINIKNHLKKNTLSLSKKTTSQIKIYWRCDELYVRVLFYITFKVLPHLKTICLCNILNLIKKKFIKITNSTTSHINIWMKDEYCNIIIVSAVHPLRTQNIPVGTRNYKLISWKNKVHLYTCHTYTKTTFWLINIMTL